MKKFRFVYVFLFALLTLGIVGNFVPQIKSSMVADYGDDTYPLLSDVRAWAGENLILRSCHHTNGLTFFGTDSYPTPFGVRTPYGSNVDLEDSIVGLCDSPTSGWYYGKVYYNATSTYLSGYSKSYEVTARTKDYLEVTYHFILVDKPAIDVAVRTYKAMPYINLTMIVTTNYPTDNLRCVPDIYSASGTGMQGIWDGIYFSGLGWSNYTGTDSTVNAVDPSNITSWDDNWFVMWKNNTSTIPLMGMAFTNRSEIEKVEVNSKLSENGIYYVRPWLKDKDGVTQWIGTYIYFAMQNVDPNNLEWKGQAEDLAHMSMTERDLTYSLISETSITKTYEVSATFNDASIGGWSIDINKTVPTFQKQDGYFYTSWGNVSYVDSGQQFTIERFKTDTPDTYTLLSWAKTMVNDWATSDWWVDQQSPKVVGWKTAIDTSTISVEYSVQIMMGYYEYYQLTSDVTLISNVDKFARYICDNLIEASGKVPLTITISTGATSAESYMAFYGLMMAYELTNNVTFLEKAKLNWNRIYSVSDGGGTGWMRYWVDCQMSGTIMLHQATANSTYYDVMEYIATQIIAGIGKEIPKLSGNGVDDYSGLFGIDISQHSHCLRALDYVIRNYGDITDYDLNDYIEKGIEWSIHNRDSYGGQVLYAGTRYIYYSCHQIFSASASLFYLEHLMRNEGEFNRTYFKHALENLGWIQGNNELSFDFFNESTGRVMRCIALVNSVPTAKTDVVAYDQGHLLEFLVRLSQVQNDVFQHDQGIDVKHGIRITETTATITNITLTSTKLTVTLSHNETSITKVYCGDKGEPIVVIGAMSWSYNSETKILTINVLHDSSKKIMVYFDEHTPPTTVISLSGVLGNKDWFISEIAVTLSAMDDLSGVDRTEYSFDNDTWNAYTMPFTIGAEGYTIIYYKSTDKVGNAEIIKNKTIKIDKTAPLGSININNGDKYTTSTSVALTLTATDATSDVYRVRLSNDGVWDTEPWEEPSTTKTWTLTPEDGTKTVHYQIKDNAGLVSDSYPDKIILDTIPPTGLITIAEGSAYTNSSSLALTLLADDATSGVAEMRFSNDGITWSLWETYAVSKSWALTTVEGIKTVYVQYRDNAGLVSDITSDTITLDTLQPSIAITSPSNGSEIKSSSITIDWTGSDTGSGIDLYEIRHDNGEWINVGMDTTYTFTALSDGSHTAEVRAIDKTGKSQVVSISFTVNTSPLFGPSYMEEVVITAAMIMVALGTAVYLVKSRKKS